MQSAFIAKPPSGICLYNCCSSGNWTMVMQSAR
jgi:hypothetical protein